MEALPQGKEGERTYPREGASPQPAPPSSASPPPSPSDALLPPPAAGEGAMSAADMAPGGAAGGGGGSSGGVLHFVGSCCGELGTNSNQQEAQRGVHLRRLCPAPRGKRIRVPPAAPQGGEERSGRRPGAGSQALRPPSAKMEDAHFPCAALPPALAMAVTPAPSRTCRAQPLFLRAGPALPHPLIPPCPGEGERANTRPASSSRYQFVSTTRSSVPCREEPGSGRGRHFPPEPPPEHLALGQGRSHRRAGRSSTAFGVFG